MAFLEGIAFTGSLGELSAYRMRGSKKIILRRKGGASKEKIKKSPQFDLPRRYQSEFGGRASMGKEVRLMLAPLCPLADYNISGPISSILNTVQIQDKISPLGQRSIRLSQHPRLLEGFSLNDEDRPSFDSIVRQNLSWSLDRETRSARINIPELLHGINFFPQYKAPLFSIVVSLGVVPDFTFNEAHGCFEPPAWYEPGFGGPAYVSTPWHATEEGSPATTLDLTFNNIPADESYSLMLSVGIRFGTLYGGGEIKQVKRIGAAKILALQGSNATTTFTPDDNGPKPVEKIIPVIQPPQDRKTKQERSTPLVGNANTTTRANFVYSHQETPKQNQHQNSTSTTVETRYTYSLNYKSDRIEEDGREDVHNYSVDTPLIHSVLLPDNPISDTKRDKK